MAGAVDMSNWGEELSDAEAECLGANGYVMVIAGLAGQYWRQQLSMAARHGLRRQAYTFLYWDDPRAQTRAALEKVQATPVEMLWLDAEQPRAGFTPAQVVAKLRECVGLCAAAGQRCGIYTRRGWWVPETADSRAFAELPLWDARYISREGDAIPAFVPYGGWTRAYMTQWHNTTEVCGQSVDINELEEDEMFVRLNGTAPYWTNKKLARGTKGVMELGVDFPAAPAQARTLRLEVFLEPGSAGTLVMMDGTGAYAGQFNGRRLEGFVDVVPKGQQAQWKVEGGAVQIKLVGIVGYTI